MNADRRWRPSGSYFEACNCDAICPCRRQGGRKLTDGSTYGVCSFALSWHVVAGQFAIVGPVSCGIPGHDRPGEEVRTEVMRVSDRPLDWDVAGRCGFATTFDYSSD